MSLGESDFDYAARLQRFPASTRYRLFRSNGVPAWQALEQVARWRRVYRKGNGL